MSADKKKSPVLDSPTAAEREARKQGWRPRDVYIGDPSKFRSAEEFLEVANIRLRVLRERLRNKTEEVAVLTAAIESQKEEKEIALREQRERIEAEDAAGQERREILLLGTMLTKKAAIDAHPIHSTIETVLASLNEARMILSSDSSGSSPGKSSVITDYFTAVSMMYLVLKDIIDNTEPDLISLLTLGKIETCLAAIMDQLAGFLGVIKSKNSVNNVRWDDPNVHPFLRIILEETDILGAEMEDLLKFCYVAPPANPSTAISDNLAITPKESDMPDAQETRAIIDDKLAVALSHIPTKATYWTTFYATIGIVLAVFGASFMMFDTGIGLGGVVNANRVAIEDLEDKVDNLSEGQAAILDAIRGEKADP